MKRQDAEEQKGSVTPPVSDVGAGRALRRIAAQARKALLRFRVGQQWERGEDGFARRIYPDYETYLEHQKTKFDAARSKFVVRHDERFHAALSERLSALTLPLQRKAVLCIAARQGTEVRAFIDRGAFAVGIDLNPGRDNRYVVVGDFHALQFAAGSVDIVYTNSLDHAFDLDRVLAEIHRVLADDGVLIAEVNANDEEAGSDAGFYESAAWESIERMIERIASQGFVLEQRSDFTVPWRGEQLLLRRADRQA